MTFSRRPTDPDEAPEAGGPLRPAVPGQAFRDAIARVPSAVHIITTAGPAGRRGFTATAFASVSDDPATILVCLNLKSSQNEAFRRNAVFAVNMLPPAAQPVADVFAGRGGVVGEARFEHGVWSSLVTGSPILDGAPMALDCDLVDSVEMGTHAVMFGRVVAVSGIGPGAREDEGVLIYRDRHYDKTRAP
ncbi:flavin reductase family protein [Chthonobacter rhizosphaerae]|uniref:flavin reductase family protein n=1 Tax=Chthonobacter rhizosphaerae TaxID=2735553 RepID=UPI0015EF936C|nr:flavin reductase family protein [Chthonobacter rhizosphaerae]